MTAIPVLEAACTGLLMPSESDAPFETFVWADVSEFPISAPQLRQLLGQPGDTPVETTSLEDLFANIAFAQDWHDPVQQEQVPRFHSLLEAINTQLSQVQVFRVGTVNIQVLIVGQLSSGEIGGVTTSLVET